MAEKPILFNTEMVKAIMEGRKRQTRRLVKVSHRGAAGFNVCFRKSTGEFTGVYDWDDEESMYEDRTPAPCQPGDILWVRETWCNRDMKAWAGSAGINDQWCQNFVDWVFVTAFGLELAKKLIYTFTNYTPTGSNAFKKKDRYIKRGKGTPKRGDVIYFFNSSKGRIGHVGIVYKVTSSKVYTIEGNTSGASTLVTNGGGVKKKSYSLTSTYIDGYGSVDYSVITGDIGETPATLKLGDRELKNYTEGPDVKELQETLISMGYDCGSFGADGEYGDCTEMAVRAFQKDTGVKVNGKYDADTHKALTAALDKQKSETEPEKAQYVQIQKNRKCYVRTAPSTDGKALGVAHSEDKLPYQGQTSENGWLLVSYTPKGETIPTNAWVSGKYGKLVS